MPKVSCSLQNVFFASLSTLNEPAGQINELHYPWMFVRGNTHVQSGFNVLSVYTACVYTGSLIISFKISPVPFSQKRDMLGNQLQMPQVETDCILISLESIGDLLAIVAAVGELSISNEEHIFFLLHMAFIEVEGCNSVMSREQFQFLLERKFKADDIAKIFSVSKRTVRRRMMEYGLSVRQTYSAIPDEELRRQISEYISHCPNAGTRTVTGHLSSKGIRLVTDSLPL